MMPQSGVEWALTRDYWAMLAKRYAGIFSKYLTFDLCNEVEPQGGEREFAVSKDRLASVIAAIRETDPERVLLYSQESVPQTAWTETIASLGVAVGCHPYRPNFIATADFSYAEQNPYAEPCWPQPYFPMGAAMEGEAPIVLRGEVSGAKLSVHIWNSNESPLFDVYADGVLLERFAPTDGLLGETGDYYYGDVLYSLQIPTNTQEVTIQVGRDGHYTRIDTLILEKSGVTTIMVPSDTCDYPDRAAPPPLIVNGDGTYQNSKGTYFDEDYIYQTAVKPYRDIANKYGVGFMRNEFGMFGTGVYSYGDGRTETVKYCKELVNQLRAHTMK